MECACKGRVIKKEYKKGEEAIAAIKKAVGKSGSGNSDGSKSNSRVNNGIAIKTTVVISIRLTDETWCSGYCPRYYTNISNTNKNNKNYNDDSVQCYNNLALIHTGRTRRFSSCKKHKNLVLIVLLLIISKLVVEIVIISTTLIAVLALAVEMKKGH